VLTVRLLQAWWLFLAVCLVYGISNIQRHNVLSSVVGIIVNLAMQFAAKVAIEGRKQKLAI
jgi:hypothetical protein